MTRVAPPFRLIRLRDGDTVFQYFYGELGERDAVQGWKESAAQGSKLDRLNRDTGVWEPVEVA